MGVSVLVFLSPDMPGTGVLSAGSRHCSPCREQRGHYQAVPDLGPRESTRGWAASSDVLVSVPMVKIGKMPADQDPLLPLLDATAVNAGRMPDEVAGARERDVLSLHSSSALLCSRLTCGSAQICLSPPPPLNRAESAWSAAQLTSRRHISR